MLENMSDKQKEELVQYAYDICRWHHERWDGRGYPDGLKEDEIPIWAQVVSIADVYDALTSERVYKKAYSHQKAIQMILNGECGSFNPLLIQCLLEIEDVLETELKTNSLGGMTSQEIERITKNMFNRIFAFLFRWVDCYRNTLWFVLHIDEYMPFMDECSIYNRFLGEFWM